jgi:malic enzyme
VPALINALKIVGKQMSDIKVVVNGVGPRRRVFQDHHGCRSVRNIIGCDQSGTLYRVEREHELGEGLVCAKLQTRMTRREQCET